MGLSPAGEKWQHMVQNQVCIMAVFRRLNKEISV